MGVGIARAYRAAGCAPLRSVAQRCNGTLAPGTVARATTAADSTHAGTDSGGQGPSGIGPGGRGLDPQSIRGSSTTAEKELPALERNRACTE